MARHKRIVVKVGSSSLTSADGGLDAERVAYIADELAALIHGGTEVLLVSSGAIAAGYPALGYTERPGTRHERQASAAVGQALLMQAYIEPLASRGLTAAQILLTGVELVQPTRRNSVGRTIEELLKRGVVPIFNENDSVPVGEIQVGDNDRLAALIANLVGADRLLIFTDTDGLYTADPQKDPNSTRIEEVDVIDDALLEIAGGAGSSVGTGGMRSKLEAARIATGGGVNVFIGKADQLGDVAAAATGDGRGTVFSATSPRTGAREIGAPLPQRSSPIALRADRG